MRTEDAAIGLDSPAPRRTMPYSVSTPTTFGIATTRPYRRDGMLRHHAQAARRDLQRAERTCRRRVAFVVVPPVGARAPVGRARRRRARPPGGPPLPAPLARA